MRVLSEMLMQSLPQLTRTLTVDYPHILEPCKGSVIKILVHYKYRLFNVASAYVYFGAYRGTLGFRKVLYPRTHLGLSFAEQLQVLVIDIYLHYPGLDCKLPVPVRFGDYRTFLV